MEALRAREGVKDLEEKSHENKRKEFDNEKQVQKFKYVYPTKKTLGYRVILATYANVLEAAGEDEDLLKRMKAACDEGGNWVGKLYYQYEVITRTHTWSRWRISWACTLISLCLCLLCLSRQQIGTIANVEI